MPGSDGPTEDAATEFAAAFGEGAFADAVELLTDDGRDRVVDSFPDEFRDGPLETEEALERYWWGLHGQYGEFEGVGAVTTVGDEAPVALRFADGSENRRCGRGRDFSAVTLGAPPACTRERCRQCLHYRKTSRRKWDAMRNLLRRCS